MSRIKCKLMLFISCLAFSAALMSQDRQVAVAVQMPTSQDSSVDSFFKHQLRGLLEEAVVNTGSYRVVDRGSTDKILKEHRIQHSGLISGSEIKGYGKTLGADYIIVSELQLSESKKRLSIICSMINVETAEIIKTASVTAENDEDAFEIACYGVISKLNLDQIRSSTRETLPPEKSLAKEIKNSVGMELVLIPAGDFIMGNPRSKELGSANDKPSHKVTISRPFYIGRYEVTQAEWREVMGNNPSPHKGNEIPVTKVSWEDAKEFCMVLSKIEGVEYRLPFEAEWEYACKAGSLNGDYEPLELFAWYSDNSKGNAQMVGQKKPNKWGLHDMAGNVGEWCEDWFDAYSPRQKTDPTGPTTGRFRIVRGGSYAQRDIQCRPTARSSIPPIEKYDFIGFRVIRIVSNQ